MNICEDCRQHFCDDCYEHDCDCNLRGHCNTKSRTRYVSEFGQRFDARVPRRDITWLVGRFHVSKPDSEIESWIRSRAPKDCPETLVRHCVRYAIAVHTYNREIFNFVQRGH